MKELIIICNRSNDRTDDSLLVPSVPIRRDVELCFNMDILFNYKRNPGCVVKTFVSLSQGSSFGPTA